jgi:hypothetical protein
MAAVPDDAQTLRALPALGMGSLQNLVDRRGIDDLRGGIDAGIGQSDVLAYAKVARGCGLPANGQEEMAASAPNDHTGWLRGARVEGQWFLVDGDQ